MVKLLLVFIIMLMGGTSSLQVSQRDTQRADDLARFLTAINDYQTNNMGKTPWRTGETDKNFVRRYIDTTCTTTNAEDYDCTGNEFRDPDGTTYGIKYEGKLATGKTDTIDSTSMDHKFHVWTNAVCDDDGKVKAAYGERQVAIEYRLESGEITCNDNY